MRDSFEEIAFRFSHLPNVWVGDPDRGILHTDGNPNPHTALNALEWGDRTGAFSITYYVEGKRVYSCVSEDYLAFHTKEARVAARDGYPTEAPGVAGPRGDIKAIGFEHVMQPDGSWDQETRITSVLLGAEIQARRPQIKWSEHATWDPWQRPNDVGPAVYIPDWILDVLDVVAGHTPYRTVGLTASGEPYGGAPPPEPHPPPDLGLRLATVEEEVVRLQSQLTLQRQLIEGRGEYLRGTP